MILLLVSLIPQLCTKRLSPVLLVISPETGEITQEIKKRTTTEENGTDANKKPIKYSSE